MKYGIRIHWGLYSVAGFTRESWPFLELSYRNGPGYNEMYRTWNPSGFDADAWTSLFAENGLRMFAFTTKHHEGFSMFDTHTRVKQRVRWDAPGRPQLENCDLAYSIMETPFKRDVVKELCEAGRKRGLRISSVFLPSRLVRRRFPALCRRSGGCPFRGRARSGMASSTWRVKENHMDGT